MPKEKKEKTTIKKDDDSKKTDISKKKTKSPYLWFFIFWILAISIGYALTRMSEVALGMFFGAVLSFILMSRSLNDEWEGTISEIKKKVVYDNDGNQDTRMIAHIKTKSGKTKKMSPMHGWQVGDHIIKVKGESAPRKV